MDELCQETVPAPGTATSKADDGLDHLLLLEALDGSGNISHRALGESLGMATTTVSRLIRELLEDHHIEAVDRRVRPCAYWLTPGGREYRRRLADEHFHAVLDSFRSLRKRIGRSLGELEEAGVERLVLYGSGEVADMALSMARARDLEVVGIVDADPRTRGARIGGFPVRGLEALPKLAPDGVLITVLEGAGEIRLRIEAKLVIWAPVLEL